MFHFRLGHASPQAELKRLKQASALNPNYNMVIKYLDCLNRLADQMIPNSNLPIWLIEVQHLITLLQKRVFSRVPLWVVFCMRFFQMSNWQGKWALRTPVERSALLNFAQYWRSMTRPPYSMGRPEAQIVMITLAEFATRWNQFLKNRTS